MYTTLPFAIVSSNKILLHVFISVFELMIGHCLNRENFSHKTITWVDNNTFITFTKMDPKKSEKSHDPWWFELNGATFIVTSWPLYTCCIQCIHSIMLLPNANVLQEFLASQKPISNVFTRKRAPCIPIGY